VNFEHVLFVLSFSYAYIAAAHWNAHLAAFPFELYLTRFIAVLQYALCSCGRLWALVLGQFSLYSFSLFTLGLHV